MADPADPPTPAGASPAAPTPALAGVLLAAGAGRRFGGPKALAATPDAGGWLERGVRLLLEAGCDPVLVVLGAEAERALALLPTSDRRVRPVVATRWAEGVGASLRAALQVLERQPDGQPLADRRPAAALVTLVDLPRLAPEALERVTGTGVGPSSLRRAVYGGTPGHPVLIGSAHWPGLLQGLEGDTGAGPYLRAHRAEAVECSGLGGDDDVDTPAQPPAPAQPMAPGWTVQPRTGSSKSPRA
ncbi:nucleotidyltransferase family protein [Sinomonas susongensis]|uniref:nucleotidyltransferase family protein n=1 Tax=Sinomonas susongensis TaxID=1324851 RepID=UPI00110961EF|nr:nucleotidyltransferase family protein [Sinomonas susongensis]